MSDQTDLSAVEALEPSAVWRFFAGMAAVPRPSKHEERIRAHVRATVEKLGLKVTEDGAGNMVVEVPATEGCESAPITVLQAHLDMVCEKNAGTDHDFSSDPIRLLIDKDAEGKQIVRADGTTLGADNGIGAALALAAASDPDVVHGALELLFTMDEEEGMTGAAALAPGVFRGRRLLNLDSEEDDALYIGCAGGSDTNLAWEFSRQPFDGGGERCRVIVSGLRGGHSGGDIHENRGNANKLLVRTLLRSNRDDLRIASIQGGSKRNAIPREAGAVVCGSAGIRAALAPAAQEVQREGQAESAEVELVIEVEEVARNAVTAAVSAAGTKRLLAALTAIPHGVLGMHMKMPGLVQTSNNFATIVTKVSEDRSHLHVLVETLSRSSSESRLDEVLEQIAAIGMLAGAKTATANRYPGWDPNVDSPILATTSRVYEKLFGERPKVAAIHAGLECGIIGKRMGGMDTVSFGPRIEGAHSPDERVWVESVQKSWQYLKAVLAELARG